MSMSVCYALKNIKDKQAFIYVLDRSKKSNLIKSLLLHCKGQFRWFVLVFLFLTINDGFDVFVTVSNELIG